MITLLFGRVWAQDGSVTLPLDEWRALSGTPTVASEAPSVRLGAARYRGRADGSSTLELTVSLDVSLAGDGLKDVPLLGPDVVLRGASVGGVPIPVAQVEGRPVWRTARVGDVTVVVDAVVAPSGQRGSLEYDFGVVATPITTLDLVFPRPDVLPKVERAVSTEVRVEGATTRLLASLERTERVVLLGLRELGSTAGAEARLYAETAHLLAVDERELELFTVVRYDILYASANRFEVFVPEGLEVVSADGEGAFTWHAEPAPGGVLVVGETATPMRKRYELSLELARELPDGPTRFLFPRAARVERENGWVGVEAPGRVRLDAIGGLQGLESAPLAQLPEELRSSSVSPLLQGFRLTGGDASCELSAQPLPEVEARAERIDGIVARSVVSSNGRVLTEMVLTLRNRLRPGLGVTLPPGATLVRALRDGQIVTPSQASTGEIIVPLRRSGPDLPFTVQLVVSQEVGALGWAGDVGLELPALDWPAAEVEWTVDWPDTTWFFAPRAPVPDQVLAGYGQWLGQGAPGNAPDYPSQVGSQESDAAWHRYWVPAGEVLRLSALHAPRPLMWLLSAVPWLVGALAVLGALGVLAVRVGTWAVRQRAAVPPR